MKQFSNHLVAVDQGDVVMFTDFEDGGDMWTGTGARERRRNVGFSKAFHSPPIVHTSISLWDVDTKSPVRIEVTAQNVTTTGFDIVFRTWLDTRIARLRVSWMAIGEVENEDDWKIY